MRDFPARQLSLLVLASVIIFTILAGRLHQIAAIRGLWIASVWQAASWAGLMLCGQLLRPPMTQRRAWCLAGAAVLKFPALYALGFWALRHLAPSPIGLAIGLTLPWAVLVTYAIGCVIKSALQPTAASS